MLINKAGTADNVSISLTRTRHIQDENMVGVVIAPDFGGGFSTWSNHPDMCLDPVLVQWVLDMNQYDEGSAEYNQIHGKLSMYVTEKYDASYHGDRLVVVWVPQGTKFIVHEYDGAESVWREDQINWRVA